LPAQHIDFSLWNIPNDIVLGDPGLNEPAAVDMLLGADVFVNIVLDERRCRNGFATLINMHFGWVLSGRFSHQSIASCGQPRVVSFVKAEGLEEKLQRFWEIEELPHRAMSREERLCEEHFQRHTARDKDGRFVVRLPVHPDAEDFCESRQNAVRRLRHMETRFSKNPDLKKDYVKFMNEYLDLGHMEEVPEERSQGLVCYLPHHCVLKESSTTTKLRVVFDGSCKASNGVSLNSILMVGPVVQPDLISIVLRFRSYMIAMSADIAKMYRCVDVHPKDRDLLRIVWRNTTEDAVKDYRLTTVTYGTSSASFLATRCLNHLAIEGQQEHPAAAFP
jgi:hypothetical protein